MPLEHFHNCCGADWLICGRLAIGLLDSAPQAKRIANPLQDTILPHNICENALIFGRGLFDVIDDQYFDRRLAPLQLETQCLKRIKKGIAV
jgi:hypothetical protein